MTASDAMERENEIERQLKDAAKEIEELRGKLSQGPRQTINTTPATDVLDCYEDATSGISSNRLQLQLPSAGFSQRNLLLRSAPHAKRPRTDISQQQMPQNFRASPMTPTSGESRVTPHAQTQGVSVASAAGTAGPCNPLSVDAIRELVTRNAQTLRTTSPEMLFIQLCLRSGTTLPFKQLLQAFSESGSLGESEVLMHGAELLSSL